MRWFVVILLALHGSIHVMGFLKAFGLAELPQLVQPIGRGAGMLWLAATLLTLGAAGCLVAAPRWWKNYRSFGPRRVSTQGEGRWHAPAPEGEFPYIVIELMNIEYNVQTPR